MENIPIVLATDMNYIVPAKVAIWSCIEQKGPNDFYDFYILCDSSLTYPDRNFIMELEEKFSNISISFVEVKACLFADAPLFSHITLPSYYRLMICDLLPQIEKCLYLDVDIIACMNVRELYDYDLNNCVLGAVKDCGVQKRKDDYKGHEKVLGLTDLEGYINAGILVMDLRKMREMNLTARMLEEIPKGYPIMDQDIINKCCQGIIRYLPLRFNLFSDYYQTVERLERLAFSLSELEETKKKGCIVHFAGPFKPWDWIRCRHSELWWNTAKRALQEKVYEKLRIRAEQQACDSDWQSLCKKLEQTQEIVLFGFSEVGKACYDLLIKSGFREKINCFCDNDKDKFEKDYRGCKVWAAKKICKQYPKAFWLITNQKAHKQIRLQLKTLGIAEDRMFRYYKKTQGYYFCLDPAYAVHEARQYAWMEAGVQETNDSVKYREAEDDFWDHYHPILLELGNEPGEDNNGANSN